MERYLELFSRDRFCEMLGIEILEVRKGYAKVQMRLKEEHQNFFQTVHGGAIFALADAAFGAAANTREKVTMAMHVSIDFLKAPDNEALLTATCEENVLGKRVCHYTMVVKDHQDQLIALCYGWARRTQRPLFDDEE